MNIFKRWKIRKLRESLFEAVLSRFEEEYRNEAERKEGIGVIPIALHLSPSQINFLKHFLSQSRRGKEDEIFKEDALHMLVSDIMDEFVVGTIHNIIYAKKSPNEEEIENLSIFLDKVMSGEFNEKK